MSEITFSEPHEVRIRDLRPGDFVVEVPTQEGIRGYKISSAVKAISLSTGGEYRQSNGYRRRRTPVETWQVSFVSHKVTILYPARFTCIARTVKGSAQ